MRRTSGRHILGILLIVIGVIWALKTSNIFSPEFEYLYLSWPVFLIVIGFLFTIRSRGNFGGLMMMLVGIAFFLSRMYGYSVGEIFSNFWPLILVAVGISILLDYWREKPRKTDSDNETLDKEVVEINSVLSGDKVNINSKNLKKVKISTMMGSSEANFFDAKPAKDCNVDVEILMGSVKLYIPSYWKVRNNVSTLFGGVEESRRRSVPLEGTEQPEIIISGSVLFGGLEIKS